MGFGESLLILPHTEVIRVRGLLPNNPKKLSESKFPDTVQSSIVATTYITIKIHITKRLFNDQCSEELVINAHEMLQPVMFIR